MMYNIKATRIYRYFKTADERRAMEIFSRLTSCYLRRYYGGDKGSIADLAKLSAVLSVLGRNSGDSRQSLFVALWLKVREYVHQEDACEFLGYYFNLALSSPYKFENEAVFYPAYCSKNQI